jgi:hypothetical protein
LRAVYVVLNEGYVLTYGSRAAAGWLYAAGALGWLSAGYLTLRRAARPARSDLLAMATGAAIVLAWTWLFQTHTTLHKFWMVRMMLVPLSLGWGAAAWQWITPAARDAGGVRRAPAAGTS